jgi:hypothetical protein
LAITTRVVTLRGGWYYHPAMPGNKVQGLPKFQQLVRTDEALRAVIVKEVLAGLKEHAAEIAPMTDPEAPVEELSGLTKMYVGGETI